MDSTVTSNATTAANATALKENSENKSTDITLADGTNTKFPTELAVKTYVTGQISTSNAATNSTIAAVQADVDANETASNSAETTLQTNVNTLTSTVSIILTNTNTAIAAVQADVDANETAANAANNLKENASNKSDDVTLADGTNTKFPTELAVKTYVDNQVASGTANNVSGIVALANGGTGSATKNFVDLTTNQIVAGAKSFSDKILVQGVEIGQTNYQNQNTVLGYQSLVNIVSGDNNTAMGFVSMNVLTSGKNNTGMGSYALHNNSVGDGNTAIGEQSLQQTTNSGNTAIGSYSLITNVSGSNNTALGSNADVVTNALTNATAIGYGAKVATNNTIQLGNTSVTNVNTSGALTTGTVTYPNVHNAISGQVLITDGNGVASWAAAPASGDSVTEVADEISANVGQVTFTLTQTPAIKSKVKMYINGIRITNIAYTISGTTLTYVPANNGAYSLIVGDRVQFDYYF